MFYLFIFFHFSCVKKAKNTLQSALDGVISDCRNRKINVSDKMENSWTLVNYFTMEKNKLQEKCRNSITYNRMIVYPTCPSKLGHLHTSECFWTKHIEDDKYFKELIKTAQQQCKNLKNSRKN